jgi:hypothetical protein
MVNRILVVMPWGRVGSNLLMELIRQFPVRKKLNSEKFNQLHTIEEQETWFENFYELHSQNHRARLIGSKQSVLSMRDIGRIETLLRSHSIGVVRMRRENCLRAAVSQIRAEQYAEKTRSETGSARWALRKGDPGLGPSRIDPELLLRRTRIMMTQQQRMMQGFLGLRLMEIEYGEINSQLMSVYERLCEFLELPRAAISIPFDKSTPEDLMHAITNYDEVERVLGNTEFREYLLFNERRCYHEQK